MEKSLRFSKVGQISESNFIAISSHGLVYNWWKTEENPLTQTRDIFDFVRLWLFPPAQDDFYWAFWLRVFTDDIFGYNLILCGMRNIKRLWQARCEINRKTLFIADKQCFSIEKHCFSLEKHILSRKTQFIEWKAEFLKNSFSNRKT